MPRRPRLRRDAARAASVRLRRAGAPAGGDLGRELLVVVDLGHVDERAHARWCRRAGRRRRARSRPSPQSPALGAEARRVARGGPDLFVARLVGDHRHLAGRRLGPVRQRHRARCLTGRAARGAGRTGGSGIVARESVGRQREPGRGLHVVGRRRAAPPARRLLGLGRSGPPSTAAWASSAPRIRTPSAGGASGRSSSNSGTRSSGTSALHQARPPPPSRRP